MPFNWNSLPDTQFKWELRAASQRLEALSDNPDLEALLATRELVAALADKTRAYIDFLGKAGCFSDARLFTEAMASVFEQASALAEASRVLIERKLVGFKPTSN